MAGSRTPRDDPAIQAFDTQLSLCTLHTPLPPFACGRPYVRVSKLSKWFRGSALREDGSTDYQARILLDYAYRQWPSYPRIGMSTARLFDEDNDRRNECIIVFSILLKMDRGCLVHFFRNLEKYDRHLPINVENLTEIFYYIIQYASDHRQHFDPITLAHEFDDLQYQFCPAKFDLGDERHFNHKQVIPIAEKSMLGDGGTAVLWQVAILEEFVTEKLAAAVEKSRYSEPDDNLGDRYHFALKTFKQGHMHEYTTEVDAFGSLTHSGMIQFLGSYTQGVDRADAKRGIGSGEAATQDTYNILLEFGECDLWTVFNEESSVPPVLQSDIDSFWTSLFHVAYALSRLHYQPDTGEKKGEFWGWHADIKPSNILEIDRQFKLADPGFAIFKAKVGDTRPTARLSGGTKTYSAPEQVRAGVHEFYQTVDVWALGCVFSIAATWIALGHQGVRKYTQLREEAGDRAKRRMSQLDNPGSLQLNSGDYFHDGIDVLPEVTAWHDYIRKVLRGTDRVTRQVLDVVDRHMIIREPLERWQSNDVSEKLYKISLGLEDLDPNATIPETIMKFLEISAENAASLGADSAHDKVVATSRHIVPKTHGRREKKSRYFSTSLEKAWTSADFIPRDSGQSPIMPETPLRTPSRIVSGPMYGSPTHSGFISPAVNSPDSEYIQQALHSTLPRLTSPPKLPVKFEDIFQANERIEDSQSTRNFIKSMGKKPVDDYLAKHYQNRDIKFLVDNSWSMHKHWAHVKFVLKTLAAKAKGLDPDGTDLYFTLSSVKVEKTKGVKPLMDAMVNRKVVPAAENDLAYTDMATQLNNLFETHLNRASRSRNNTAKLTIIVLTNAMWDEVQVAKRIVEFAKKLEVAMEREITDRPVSVEFIQFGRDPEATDRLKRLDDELKPKGIPDLVDAEHSEGNVYKMLLGSFVPVFDDDNTEMVHNDDAATIRPHSSEMETYFERQHDRQNTMNSYTSPPPLLAPFSSPRPQINHPGPSLTRESTYHEDHSLNSVPQRHGSQRQARSPNPRSREERRNTNASHRPHHQASGSRDAFF